MLTDLKVGQIISDFKVINIDDLKEYRSLGIELEHRTGAKAYHIYNDDQENTFSFSFNTPVDSSNGVPHIVEHSVLSGSRLYDLKDPFQGMMKGSVNTFLNAYTFPDKTSYPASSILEKDFFNLLSVYGDAVFFPRLKKETFLQEGWRVDFDENDTPFYTGIVYNEMKGVYSSHDSMVHDASINTLFSQGSYSFDSGGNPANIPELTYDAFLEYHKKWYHPSNCYIYLYGNIPTEKTLTYIDSHFLSHFNKIQVDGVVKDTESWEEPRAFHKFTSSNEDKKRSSDLLMSWKMMAIGDPEESLALEILNKILLGSSAAPLKKALDDSDFWDDLSNASGLENEISNYIYSVGVRGADPGSIDIFKNTVNLTLKNIVKKGFDKDVIEGALRRFEFINKEIQGSFGLRLMRKVLRGWLHGYEPKTTLEFDKWIKVIRNKSSNERYFENLIEKYLLKNTHRADIIVEPSSKEKVKEEEEIDKSLKELKSKLSTKDIELIKSENKLLLDYQNKPDTPEAVRSLPRLTKEDIPLEVPEIGTTKEIYKGWDLYKTDLYTNGIAYIGFGFSMEYLDKFFFNYMLIFTRMLTHSGFIGRSYDEVSKDVSLILGGIGSSMETSNTLKDSKPNYYIENFYIRCKVLENYIEDGLDLIKGFLTKVDFHDYRRLKSIITEIRNDLKSSLVSSGTSYASLRSARKFSLASCREEAWYGVTQAQFLEDLVNSIDNEGVLEEVATILDSIKRELFTKQGLFFHISSSESYEDRLKKSLDNIIESLPDGESFVHPVEHYDFIENIEGLVANSKVSYTGLTVKGAFLGSKEYSAQIVLCNLLKTGYLWENIRMKGGAYGAFVSCSGMDGSITFGSYRDPNIAQTIDHYKQSLEWMAAGNITQEEVDLAIISVIGKELKPLTPMEKSIIGHRRSLLGITKELRQHKRENILKLSKQDIMDFAAAVLHFWDESSIAILSSKEALLEASKDLEGLEDNLINLPS